MITTKYQQTNTGRPYSEVRGYLRNNLELPVVAAGELTPSSAPLAVYATHPDTGAWRHVGETTVWAYDESMSALALYYIRATITADATFEVVYSGCSKSLLTLPAIRKAAIIAVADNTAAPPTEVEGDRYLLDTTVGGVHADWDGAAADDIVQFISGSWVAYTPGHRWVVLNNDTATDLEYSAESPAAWS